MKKILMIEDDLELAEILTEYLQQFDFEIITEDDPFKAVSILKLEPFDLVILDLTLPGMDGLEVCEAIRERQDIPIIISSARSVRWAASRGSERGVSVASNEKMENAA